jgi:hypothetical protein
VLGLASGGSPRRSGEYPTLRLPVCGRDCIHLGPCSGLRTTKTRYNNAIPNATEQGNLETLSRVRTPLCSPERETETLTVGLSDMMCDVGNAAIKDAIANIARSREVLHFLRCIARFLGHFSGLATIRSSGFPPRNAPNSIRRPWGV